MPSPDEITFPELSKNMVEASIEVVPKGIAGTVGYNRGPIEIGLQGGIRQKKGFAGARATWRF